MTPNAFDVMRDGVMQAQAQLRTATRRTWPACFAGACITYPLMCSWN